MTSPINLSTVNIGGQEIANIFLDLQKTWDTIKSEFQTDEIAINGAPRPELLSTQVYGTPDFWWLILVVNEVIDPFNDWIKDEDQLLAWVAEKYEDPNAIRHHLSPEGQKYFDVIQIGQAWYDAGDPGGIQPPVYVGALTPVTFYEHESAVNEGMRRLTLIVPRQIRDCAERFYEELNIDVV